MSFSTINLSKPFIVPYSEQIFSPCKSSRILQNLLLLIPPATSTDRSFIPPRLLSFTIWPSFTPAIHFAIIDSIGGFFSHERISVSLYFSFALEAGRKILALPLWQTRKWRRRGRPTKKELWRDTRYSKDVRLEGGMVEEAAPNVMEAISLMTLLEV